MKKIIYESHKEIWKNAIKNSIFGLIVNPFMSKDDDNKFNNSDKEDDEEDKKVKPNKEKNKKKRELVTSTVFKNFHLKTAHWRILYKQRKYAEVIAIMEKFLSDTPKLTKIEKGLMQFEIGQMYGVNNDYPKAIELLESDDVVYTIETNYRRGMISFFENDRGGIQNFIDKLENDRPGDENLDKLKELVNKINVPYRDIYKP